jgi:plastocyanin
LRKTYAAATAAVLMLVVAGAAFAATRGGGPVVKTPGGPVFKVNQYAQDTVHFAPGTVTVQSGGTVTFMKTDKDPEPHTVTISTKKDLPRSFNSPCRPCELASHHLKNPKNENSPVARWVLNKGADGFDVEGDSLALAPKGLHKSASVVISAPSGTTLYYVCAVHPWMQGKIVVT